MSLSEASFQETPQPQLVPIKRALISVSDKTNLNALCAFLHKIGCELFATTSTCQAIRQEGLPCTSTDSLTQFPDMLGGRVKTLHPNIFGAILGRPHLPQDQADLEKFHITPFDVVICNLYPFQEARAKGLGVSALIEHIDIGGVSLLRAAAKNNSTVAILCDPADYALFQSTLTSHDNHSTQGLRRALAQKAFQETAAYDALIGATLSECFQADTDAPQCAPGPLVRSQWERQETLDSNLTTSLVRVQSLRYGENPHQKAAFYKLSPAPESKSCSLANLVCLQGKELSYNNMLDIEHALRLITEFSHLPQHAAVILKHNTPCGVGLSTTSVAEAYQKAFEGDTVSPFGGIVCTNSPVTGAAAALMADIFLEVIIAPRFEPEALEYLSKKKNLRLVTYPARTPLANSKQWTAVQGGFLVQDADRTVFDPQALTCPTQRQAPKDILQTAFFAMSIVKHVRSNAIAIANSTQTISLAGGFTNRVDAVEHALRKARLPFTNAILASDAFFPFPDSIDLIQAAGISYIVQPGGSVQDTAVIQACDKHNLCMLFTGQRHFKH